ncbi:hypothetical protein ACPA0F_09165 [Solibacillus silvestris]
MAEKSGFFNALLVDNQYDRKYNANDYSDNLSFVISNGVLRSEADDLLVTASGMIPTVAAGRAWIKGHYYINDAAISLPAITAPTGGKRYDRIMLRLSTELNDRNISVVYVQGTAAATPTKPAPTRTNSVYDLVLADIYVDTNATNLVITDTRSDASICGWVYSTSGDNSFFTSLDANFGEWFQQKKETLASVTLFKRYTQSATLTSSTTQIAILIPQYDEETCFVEVYVNGIFDTRHTVADYIVTFEGTLTAGTVVTINVYKSIDGTDIMSVSDEITELQNEVATIIGANKFAYNCTGLNDNIAISEIAQAIYSGSYTVGTLSTAAEAFLSAIGGNTYLAQLPAEGQVYIDVVGKLGATTPAAGSGTTESRYRWFNIGIAGTSEKKVIFDFAKCQKITIACSASTNNIIFYGTDLNIRNANVYAYSNGASCLIAMCIGSAANGYQNFDNCRFSISTSGDGVIAENGTFTNCFCIVKSSAGNAICFSAKSAGLIRLIGGTFYTYIGTSSMICAVMYVAAGETNGVIIADNINAPTVSVSGFSQRNLAVANTGNIYVNGVCSTMTSTGSTATVSGQIWKTKR